LFFTTTRLKHRIDIDEGLDEDDDTAPCRPRCCGGKMLVWGGRRQRRSRICRLEIGMRFACFSTAIWGGFHSLSLFCKVLVRTLHDLLASRHQFLRASEVAATTPASHSTLLVLLAVFSSTCSIPAICPSSRWRVVMAILPWSATHVAGPGWDGRIKREPNKTKSIQR